MRSKNIHPLLLSFATALCLFFLTIPTAKAQSNVFPKWISTLPFAAGASAFAADPAGNVFAVGDYCPPTCTHPQAFVFKFDQTGKIIWKDWLSNSNFNATALDVGIDSESNVYVLFQLDQGGAQGSFVNSEVVTAKYTSSGVRQWINFLSSPSGFSNEPVKLAVSPSGNAYVLYNSINVAEPGQIAIMKYNTNGQLQWSSATGVGALPGNGISLKLDAVENSHVLASVDAPARVGVAIVNSNGLTIGSTDPFQFDGVGDFSVDADGHTYFVGSSAGSPAAIPSGPVVAKYSVDGTLIWYKTPPAEIGRIGSDPSGNTYLAYDSSDGLGLIKYDARGNQVWVSDYKDSSVIKGIEPAVLTLNSANQIYVTGAGALLGDITSQTLTAKFDSSGNEVWAIPYQNNSVISPTAMTIGGSGLFVLLNGTFVVDYVQDAAELTPSAVTFADQKVGTQSTAQTVTLTNTAEQDLVISSITESGSDFVLINNCPTVLAPKATCTISLTFTPTNVGNRTGTIAVRDDWAGSQTEPQTTTLSGTGTS